MIKYLLSIVILLASASYGWAACTGSSPTWNATADQSSVQSCIDSATAGDTVNVAAGSFSVTGTGLNWSGKRLKLKGAGIDVTNITDNVVAGTGYALNVSNLSAANFSEVSGFTFIRGVNHANGMVQLSGAGNGTNAEVSFRFHHNKITQTVGGRGLFIYGTYGLADHNYYLVSDCASVQSISIQGTSSSSDGGWTAWSRPLTMGTDKAVYIEDSYFDRGACILNAEDALDMYSGARLVFRYNRGTNYHIGFHGTDSGGMRSPVSHEVYNNEFTMTANLIGFRAATVRGGTGVWFNNVWKTDAPGTGTWGGITLLGYRQCGPVAVEWATCDGTQYVVGSTSVSATASRRCCDISTNPTPGTPPTGGCTAFPTVTWVTNAGFDATNPDALPLGTHGVGNNTAFFDGGGAGTHGYPCRDQPGRAPGQVLEPIYAWNNTGLTTGIGSYNGGDPGNCNGMGIEYYIQSGREYFNDNTTQRPGYTAYTYPHPLSDPIAPIQPTPLCSRCSLDRDRLPR